MDKGKLIVCATPWQMQGKHQASVGPTPVKCHEPTAMALARSATCRRRDEPTPPGVFLAPLAVWHTDRKAISAWGRDSSIMPERALWEGVRENPTGTYFTRRRRRGCPVVRGKKRKELIFTALRSKPESNGRLLHGKFTISYEIQVRATPQLDLLSVQRRLDKSGETHFSDKHRNPKARKLNCGFENWVRTRVWSKKNRCGPQLDLVTAKGDVSMWGDVKASGRRLGLRAGNATRSFQRVEIQGFRDLAAEEGNRRRAAQRAQRHDGGKQRAKDGSNFGIATWRRLQASRRRIVSHSDNSAYTPTMTNPSPLRHLDAAVTPQSLPGPPMKPQAPPKLRAAAPTTPLRHPSAIHTRTEGNGSGYEARCSRAALASSTSPSYTSTPPISTASLLINSMCTYASAPASPFPCPCPPHHNLPPYPPPLAACIEWRAPDRTSDRRRVRDYSCAREDSLFALGASSAAALRGGATFV
ncbi:hypothetical protein DFH09DRAFT_1092259 [Mycena vulgaris]|nr:hypothetical protein DFH09DRAFT_1092259 [Mycena vulgaris]